MWEKIGLDRAGVEAILGKDVKWIGAEYSVDMAFLLNKALRKGLTMSEQSKLDALRALYYSRR